MERLWIQGGYLITMDPAGRELIGDIMIEDGRIVAVGEVPKGLRAQVLPAAGRLVLPGFVQTHVHLCQALFRGWADDLELLPWLHQRIWPLEASHDEDSLRVSARLGLAELLLGGTTTILDMGTVRHTDVLFEVMAASGIRAIGGKAMMDQGGGPLTETTEESLGESLGLLDRWHGRERGRLQYAFAPRFALSVTERLLQEVAEQAGRLGVRIHTHAAENRGEVAAVEATFGQKNLAYLHRQGVLGPRTVIAHAIWLDGEEEDVLVRSGAAVAHCPSANLKLASGIAAVSRFLGRGVRVGLGADGAPCNNRLDMFTEMRLAALLQKVKEGPEALPAREALRMATLGGAEALGMADEIGSIEVGKRADLLIFNPHTLENTPVPDVASLLVYGADRHGVETVIVDGRVVVDHGGLRTLATEEILRQAREAVLRVAERAGLDRPAVPWWRDETDPESETRGFP